MNLLFIYTIKTGNTKIPSKMLQRCKPTAFLCYVSLSIPMQYKFVYNMNFYLKKKWNGYFFSIGLNFILNGKEILQLMHFPRKKEGEIIFMFVCLFVRHANTLTTQFTWRNDQIKINHFFEFICGQYRWFILWRTK